MAVKRIAKAAAPVICLLFAIIFAIPLAVRIFRTPKAHGQASQMTFNGVPNQSTQVPGFLPLYNPDGTPIANGRCVQAIVTSATTTGQFSMNYAALGFTTITSFRAQVVSPSSSLTVLGNMYTANVVTATTTQMTGTVTSPVTIVVGGIGIGFGPTATQVSVGVCGS